MIRGTTPTHKFELPFEVSILKDLRISYMQNTYGQNDNRLLIDKKMTDCTLDGNTVLVKLTQEETLKLKHGMEVKIQIKVLTTEGDVLASTVYKKTVKEVLNEEVLT